jgi:exodeoxyribonuclease VII large subunit
VGFYAVRGDIQLTVQLMRRAGVGGLYEAFLKLKQKLEAAGLFDPDRKKDIPLHPRAIGIVTSSQAAALKDVLSTLARRAPHIPIVIYPSLVQGAEAPAGLISALTQANQSKEVDVILLVRGGGSIEDLWAFNDEALANAIAQSSIPIISGVGHETDFTIADFVADRRAPTPTAAAEMAAPDRLELLRHLNINAQELTRNVSRRLEKESQRLDQFSLRLSHAFPNPDRMREKIGALQSRLSQSWQARLLAWKREQSHCRAQLEALNPKRTLERGYSLILQEDQVLRDPKSLESDNTYTVQMAFGSAEIVLSEAKILESTAKNNESSPANT